MRIGLILALILLVAAGLLVALTRFGGPAGASPAPIGVAAPKEDVAEKGATPASPSASPSSPDPDGDSKGAGDPGDLVDVEGRVVVKDGDGREVADAAGSFTGTDWSGDTGDSMADVVVTAGRFRRKLRRGHDLGVNRLELGGRLAYLDEDDRNGRYPVQEGRPIEIRATWGAPILLRVVDGVSGRDLKDVTLTHGDGSHIGSGWYPGEAEARLAIASHGESPFTVGPLASEHWVAWTGRLHAIAPGYAWGSIGVNFKTGGQLTLALKAGGSLEVTLTGDVPVAKDAGKGRRRARRDDGKEPRLRLRPAETGTDAQIEEKVKALLKRDEEHSAADPEARRRTEEELRAAVRDQFKRTASFKVTLDATPDPDGTTTLSGLDPGRYSISLEVGHSFDKPTLLGETLAEVVAGGNTRVILNIPPRVEARRVPLSGTLRLSPEWKKAYVDLHFSPAKVPGAGSADEFELTLRELRPVEGRPELYRFDAGLVLPGRWLVVSYTFEVQQIVDTGPDGTTEAEIIIGDPADVVLRAVDVESGKPILEPATIYWNGRRPEESHGGSLDTAAWDPAAGVYRFRAPAGEIELSVGGGTNAEFEWIHDQIVQLKPGANEVTLKLRRLMSVVITFQPEAGTLEDASGTSLMHGVRLVAVGNPAKIVTYSWCSSLQLGFAPDQEGSYLVQFPAFEGYETPASLEIQVRKAGQTKITVPLKRIR